MAAHQHEDEPTGADRDRSNDAAHEAGQEKPSPEGVRRDDDTDVERYRDSPGMGMFTDDEDPPEPNEPG